jgi:hypothetical protein
LAKQATHTDPKCTHLGGKYPEIRNPDTLWHEFTWMFTREDMERWETQWSVKLLIKYLSRFLSIYKLCFWMSQSFRSWVSDEVVSILFGSTWHADVFTLAPIQGGLPAILPEYPKIRIDTAYLGGSPPNTLSRKSTEAVLPRQRLRSTEGSGAQDLFDAQAAAWALRSPATVARWPKDWLRMATAIKLFFICVWCCLCDNTYVIIGWFP